MHYFVLSSLKDEQFGGFFPEVTRLYFYAIYFSYTNICETSGKKLWTELKSQLKTLTKFFFLEASFPSTVICFDFDRILQMLRTLQKCTGKKGFK